MPYSFEGLLNVNFDSKFPAALKPSEKQGKPIYNDEYEVVAKYREDQDE